MSAIRTCKWLACPNWYDAIIGGAGPGWRRWTTLGLLLCPDHAHVWDDEAHGPRLDSDDPNRPVMHCGCGWQLDAYELNAGKVAEAYLLHLHDATTHARQPAVVAAAAPTAHAESHRTSEPAETLSGVKACGCVGKCPSIFKPCPVCAAEVTSVAVDNALATTYGPCGHVVPDAQEAEE